jgi:hypothetical protein
MAGKEEQVAPSWNRLDLGNLDWSRPTVESGGNSITNVAGVLQSLRLEWVLILWEYSKTKPVRLHWGSQSTRRTLLPSSANFQPMLKVEVVFDTPPL